MYRSLLPISLLFLSFIQYVKSCNKFTVQECIDIPFGFNSMSSIKCIQLVPIQFDVLIDYPVQNYLVKKTAKCYDIVSYNSSSIMLFSNQCQELCGEQYCLFFDSQPNTAVINIFYTESSIYDEINSQTDGIYSYDYLLFDTCSADNKANRILIIIVYTLAGFIGLVTIILIVKCIISKRLTKDGECHPYDWRWWRDLILFRKHPGNDPANRPGNEPNNLYIIEYDNQPPRPSNAIQRREYNHISSQAQITSTSTPTINLNRRQTPRRNYSTENSSNPSHIDFTSDLSTPTNRLPVNEIDHSNDEDLSNNNSVNETSHSHSHHQPSSIMAALHRLSSKASSVLTGIHSAHAYDTLGPKQSPEYPIIRL
ncbi:hypothetical protein I4U23_026068 [Adineta vaga]|nr:hypothetical protein I4U23_026068 [Adineta vaga]